MSNADFKDVLDICMINGILRKHKSSIVGGFYPLGEGGVGARMEQGWSKKERSNGGVSVEQEGVKQGWSKREVEARWREVDFRWRGNGVE